MFAMKVLIKATDNLTGGTKLEIRPGRLTQSAQTIEGVPKLPSCLRCLSFQT